MKRKLVLLLLGGLFAVSAMGQESCSTTETKNEPDAAGDKAAGSDSGGGEKKAPKKVAGVGDSLTLDGGSDEKMQATVIKVIDPLSGGEFDEPESGKRLVGVQMSLKNVGEAQYDDSPSNGAVLLTADDQQAETTLVSGGPCSGGFSSSAKIAPGARQQGCIPFTVPSGATLKTFQFTLSSGFGPQAGEWRLR